jgi:glycosyltransferase involved in cell wall biosynthesis
MNAWTPPKLRSDSNAEIRDELLPRISVVIPWIGREKYIGATVAALRSQDYPNLEIVVSDNSLSPAARELLGAMGDSGIRVIDRSERRLSSADHFTACIRDATGEYVMILSDDDLIEPTYVSGMYDAIRSHPISSVVLGEQIVIGENDVLIPSDSGANVVEHYHGARFFLSRLVNPRKLPIVTYVSLFARRSDLLMCPYRDYPDGSNSDNYMMLCLALRGDVTISAKKMYYRVYESSSGLKTPFSKLMESCTQFERDVAMLLRTHRSTLSPGFRLMFRLLIRARNGSMMTRRLFSLYRRRMSRGELFVSSCHLALYMFGVGAGTHSAME